MQRKFFVLFKFCCQGLVRLLVGLYPFWSHVLFVLSLSKIRSEFVFRSNIPLSLEVPQLKIHFEMSIYPSNFPSS